MNSCTSLGRTAAEVQLPSGGDARGTRAREDCEALREASLVCGVLLDARTAPQLRWLPVWQSQLLPAATAVAQLLEQHWAEPEQVKAARLATAQAASTRSCAFLRCTNLAGEAGAGAGEGAGSMRCSGCKRTWYCGTQCSHADWANNGHRRVCKLLAAARQAERQRQRQAGQ